MAFSFVLNFHLFLFVLLRVCVYMYRHVWHSSCAEVRGQIWGRRFFPSSMWVPEIEPRSVDLAASTFTCRALFWTPGCFFLEYFKADFWCHYLCHFFSAQSSICHLKRVKLWSLLHRTEMAVLYSVTCPHRDRHTGWLVRSDISNCLLEWGPTYILYWVTSALLPVRNWRRSPPL